MSRVVYRVLPSVAIQVLHGVNARVMRAWVLGSMPGLLPALAVVRWWRPLADVLELRLLLGDVVAVLLLVVVMTTQLLLYLVEVLVVTVMVEVGRRRVTRSHSTTDNVATVVMTTHRIATVVMYVCKALSNDSKNQGRLGENTC